jgi:hypothetical protein
VPAGRQPIRIVAVDLGLKHMGVAHLDFSLRHKRPRVLLRKWTMQQVNSRSTYDIHAYAHEALGLAQEWVVDGQLPHIIALERQILAPATSKIAGNSKLLSWEAALIGVLYTLQQQQQSKSLLGTTDMPHCQIVSIPSTSISMLFGLRASSQDSPQGLLDRATLRKLKKTKSVELVKEWINHNASKKKDDLADAFLVGVSIVTARIHSVSLLKSLGM